MAYSELCTFGKYYCFGCCIIDNVVPTRKELAEAFRKNTLVFRHLKSTGKFAVRPDSGGIRACGVCNNLIVKNNRIVCPLHPKIAGEDLRKRTFCYKDYLCDTAQMFNRWPEEKQKKFLKFLKSKNPDWYSFSINIENGSWLKEFQKL